MRRIKFLFNKIKKTSKRKNQSTISSAIHDDFSNVKKQAIFSEQFTPVLQDEEKISYYKKHYNFMDYHIKFFNELTSRIDFRGKTVLEIGGSNTPMDLAFSEMGVSKWVCIDKPWKTNLESQHNHYSKISLYKFKDIALDKALQESDYFIYDEFAEYMPSDFYGKFDICVSNCCFEHVNNLPLLLNKIYYSLKDGGVLYTRFAPIWSAPNGNHVRINDKALSFSLWHAKDYPRELHHAHLFKGYKGIYDYLEKNYGDDVAQKHTYTVKNGSSLNKLMYEDYLFLMHNSLFSNKSVTPAWIYNIDDKTMQLLIAMYPGYHKFDASGMIIQAKK